MPWELVVLKNLNGRRPMFVETVERNEARYCVYCGDWFECRVHLVPIDWAGNHRSYAVGDVVTVCHECSSLLSHCSKLTLSSRAEYLIRAYEKRAAKWLRVPPWSEQELQEMGYGMQSLIRGALILRSVYISKLRNLDLTELGYEPVPIPL
jgi:hypothetical protein